MLWRMAQIYRPNAAAIIMSADGKLLICERTREAGAWQFPQGGIDPGESDMDAIIREVEEEVGYKPQHYTIEVCRGGYRYDYPPEVLQYVREKRNQPYVGQEQTYFLCRLHENAPEPVLDDHEFCAYRWIEPQDFQIDWLPDFKKEVYAAVLKDFLGVDV